MRSRDVDIEMLSQTIRNKVIVINKTNLKVLPIVSYIIYI